MHSLKGLYERATKNRKPAKEPPVTITIMSREAMEKHLGR